MVVLDERIQRLKHESGSKSQIQGSTKLKSKIQGIKDNTSQIIDLASILLELEKDKTSPAKKELEQCLQEITTSLRIKSDEFNSAEEIFQKQKERMIRILEHLLESMPKSPYYEKNEEEFGPLTPYTFLKRELINLYSLQMKDEFSIYQLNKIQKKIEKHVKENLSPETASKLLENFNSTIQEMKQLVNNHLELHENTFQRNLKKSNHLLKDLNKHQEMIYALVESLFDPSKQLEDGVEAEINKAIHTLEEHRKKLKTTIRIKENEQFLAFLHKIKKQLENKDLDKKEIRRSILKELGKREYRIESLSEEIAESKEIHQSVMQKLGHICEQLDALEIAEISSMEVGRIEGFFNLLEIKKKYEALQGSFLLHKHEKGTDIQKITLPAISLMAFSNAFKIPGHPLG